MTVVLPSWDNARWDISPWALGAQPPLAGGGWGTDWEWWIEYMANNSASSKRAFDITGLVVEAQWSTDSHAMGDGTFRGDVQPGKLTVRLWDPHGAADGQTYYRYATIWALYKPLNACWAWWCNDFTRGLVPRGDRSYGDLVITADTWGPPLVNPYPSPNPVRPAETVNARLAWLVADINTQIAAGYWNSPTWELSAAVQNQVVKASTIGNYNLAPGYLPLIRDAASDGVAWLEPYRPGALGTCGNMRLRYEQWQTAQLRAMPPGMITAGPPASQAVSPMTTVSFTATEPDASTHEYSNASYAIYRGAMGPTGMRVYAVTANGSGPDYPPIQQTMQKMITVPSGTYWISNVTSDAGWRVKPDGTASADYWDPTAHIWSPIDLMTFNHPVVGQKIEARVVSTSHRLNATTWQSAHTLEHYIAPVPLSA